MFILSPKMMAHLLIFTLLRRYNIKKQVKNLQMLIGDDKCTHRFLKIFVFYNSLLFFLNTL